MQRSRISSLGEANTRLHREEICRISAECITLKSKEAQGKQLFERGDTVF